VLADIDAIDEAALDHIPAENSLRAAKQKKRAEPERSPAGESAARPEPEERYEKHEADRPAEKAMRPLPPVNRLEAFQAHPLVDELVLRDLTIFLEGHLPVRFGQWRDGAQNGLPLGDRQA